MTRCTHGLRQIRISCLRPDGQIGRDSFHHMTYIGSSIRDVMEPPQSVMTETLLAGLGVAGPLLS